mgnify:CR=1 FL=1
MLNMKGKKWYNSYKISLTHSAFHLSMMAIIIVMWIQIWSVILGQSMDGTGRVPLMNTYGKKVEN